MVKDCSNCLLRLVSALFTVASLAALGEIRYESYDLEAQLQLQLMSYTEAVNKIKELKKRLEKSEMELGTSQSLTNELMGSELSIVETTASEAKARHRSKIEATKVVVVDEQKDKILKLRRKLAFDGYNLCLKKIAKAYLKVDTKVLDHIEVFDVESEDFKDDEVSEDLGDQSCILCLVIVFL
ncbi:hypothetical protein F0562_005788 [Nyssa sinensis]|uniref:Uncharacterized protein n=1 Tax=Nyssa sinensis TaxID=561372 RepID=A0A5J5ALL3_9ASTE|nr:hypothetical protein F0562_005788 [Nyssa sinensis]